MKKISLLFSLLIIINCAPSVYIKSESDLTNRINLKANIYVESEVTLSIEHRNFRIFLMEELKKAGFNIVDSSEADYELSYSIDEHTSKTTASIPMTTTSTTSGNVGNIGNAIQYKGVTTSTQYIPYSYDYKTKQIYLFLKDKTISQGPSIVANVLNSFVCSAGIYMDINDYRNYPRSCIRKIIEYMGKNYDGNVTINTSYEYLK